MHTRERIAALVAIAAENGSTVSAEELRLLLPSGLFSTAENLEAYIRSDPVLSSSMVILDGEVAPHGAEELVARRRQQRRLTKDRIEVADRFVAGLLRKMPWVELVGISGSTAYGGAKPQDDVDFFLVTQPNRMWITLLVALVLARLTRLQFPGDPILCFNRVTEHATCVESFGNGREPLFAREALNLKILRGQAFYRELLQDAPWIADHFPALYEAKLRAEPPRNERPGVRRGPQWSAANAFAFLGLAPYLWAAGLVRNARLARVGHRSARFRTVIERDFCAYESRKYDELREAYQRTF